MCICAKLKLQLCLMCSSFLYLIFALILGATCIRPALHNDYMIAEKVIILIRSCY